METTLLELLMRMLMWKRVLLVGMFSLALASCAGNQDETELTDVLTPDEIAEDIEKSGDPGEDLTEAPQDPEADIAESEEDKADDQTLADNEQTDTDEDNEDAEPPVVVEKTHTKPVEVDANVPSFLRAHALRSKFVVVVNKSKQRLYWLEKGKLTNEYKISSGSPGYDTPVGVYSITRMHAKYVSKKYKARMDDAIFFHGGYAVHATYGKNISLLGPRSDRKGYGYSHGCVRQSPQNADDLFQRVKFHGAKNVTIVVQN